MEATTWLLNFVMVWIIAHVSTSTHWIVTEDGKLRAQPDSVLSMKQSHDLAAFINQEQRLTTVEELKADLLKQQDLVDSADKDDGFEDNFLATEESCILAGKRLPDFDLYISTVLPLENKGIRVDEYISSNADLPSSNLLKPFCDSELQYSIHALEHLAGVQQRADLKGTAELGLKSAITNRESSDEYGHLVHEALQRNSTSWVLYNMAAFYWRIKGDATQTVECLRRALHYSPENYRDVAYVSLGNVLHRAHHSEEAAVVLHAALDISAVLNVNHFTLGNIYAVLTDYNRSVEYFENTLKIQPDFEAADKRRWAVICHAKLEQALEMQHRSLQETIEELKAYQVKHDRMHKLSNKMQMEQASAKEKMRSGFAYQDRLKQRRAEKANIMGQTCHMRSPGDESSMVCVWKKVPRRVITDSYLEETRFSSVPLDVSKLREVPEFMKARPHGAPIPDVKPVNTKPEQDYSKPVRPPLYKNTEAPKAVAREQKKKAVWKSKTWPVKEECEGYARGPLEWNEYPTTFLPPENKGFESRVFLTEAIDLESRGQHPLPWYPPICVNLVTLNTGDMFMDHLSSMKERDQVPLRLPDSTMKQILLSWVNDGDVEEAEVGQRILTALKKNLAPRWLLYNLAGLYWRVIGDNYHAIECLRRSLHFVPADYLDVPLINMANILYKWNKLDDALNMTRQALIFTNYEPITHFTQANLLAAKKNESGAIFHYEKALEFDPDYEPALKMLKQLKCYIKFYKKSPSTKQCSAGKDSCKIPQPECKGPPELCNNNEDDLNILSLGAFIRKSKMIDPMEVEAMKEFHRANGICQGSDCDYIVHKPGTEPYIKLKATDNGNWEQALLFTAANDVLPQEEDECLILKKGVRSSGCLNEEFAHDEDKLKKMESVLTELNSFISKQEELGELLIDDDEAYQNRKSDLNSGKPVELDQFVDISCVTDENEDLIKCFNRKNAKPEEIELPQLKPRKASVLQNGKRVFTPTEEDCISYNVIDFSMFTSTWLSVAPKGQEYINKHSTLADVADHIDLREHIDSDHYEEPLCDDNIGASVAMFDHLPSIANKERIMYASETVLKDIIQVLGDKKESVEVMGTRIAKALKQDKNSWILGCLSALYWRVQGHAPNAINCLRMSLLHAPKESKHIPLLSLANILHKAGAVDDAIEIATSALESSPETVVIHFSLGNMYGVKRDFERADDYYQSTLRLQSTFEPARERIEAIHCSGLLSSKQETKEISAADDHEEFTDEEYASIMECIDDGQEYVECIEDGNEIQCKEVITSSINSDCRYLKTRQARSNEAEGDDDP